MSKFRIGKAARNLFIGASAAAGLAALALTVSPSARESLACDITSEVQFSPGGEYRAERTEKTCRWGVGPSPRLVELHVDKPDTQWTLSLPLEDDVHARASVPAAGSSMKWRNGNALDVTVYSGETAGTLVRRVGDLTITRRYVKPRKPRAGARA